MSPAGAAALRRDQRVLVALLAALSVAAWWWSLAMAAAPAAAHAHHAHHAHHASGGWWPLFAMWAVMMAGMMVPPEARFLLRLLRLGREAGAPRPLLVTFAFLAGHLAVWTLYSFGAALLQIALQQRGLLDHEGASNDPRLSALLLAAAGLAQLTPLKRRCLERCSAPSARLAGLSLAGAAAAGAWQGAQSVASCGLLMLVLFVTGVMSVPGMLAVTALLVIEALAPARWRVSDAAGALLCAGGLLALLR